MANWTVTPTELITRGYELAINERYKDILSKMKLINSNLVDAHENRNQENNSILVEDYKKLYIAGGATENDQGYVDMILQQLVDLGLYIFNIYGDHLVKATPSIKDELFRIYIKRTKKFCDYLFHAIHFVRKNTKNEFAYIDEKFRALYTYYKWDFLELQEVSVSRSALLPIFPERIKEIIEKFDPIHRFQEDRDQLGKKERIEKFDLIHRFQEERDQLDTKKRKIDQDKKKKYLKYKTKYLQLKNQLN